MNSKSKKSADPGRFYRTLQRYRRAVQIITLVLLIAVPLLNVLGVHWLIGSLYSISIGEMTMMDPLMALQTVLLSKELLAAVLIAAALPIVLALIFGRVFCSWMCPHNLLSEWLDAANKRIFKRRWQKLHRQAPASNPSPLWYWGIFAALLLAVMISGVPLLGYLSTPGILSVQISHVIFGAGLSLEIALVLLIFVGEIAVGKRFWCKTLCPVGACLAIFRSRRTMQLHHNPALCDCKSGTEPCHFVCPLDLSPKRQNVYPSCFNCGLCIGVCEKTGNASLTFRLGSNNVDSADCSNCRVALSVSSAGD